jgi:hypothetical protein
MAYNLDAAKRIVTRTFYSAVQITVTIPAGAADTNLPNVVLPTIAGAVIRNVYVGLKFRMIENTNVAANKMNGAQAIRIKENGGAWGVDDVAAINIVDDQWAVALSTREGGDVQIGTIDVAAEVAAFNATYNVRFENATADVASLVLYDVQVFLIVTYEV